MTVGTGEEGGTRVMVAKSMPVKKSMTSRVNALERYATDLTQPPLPEWVQEIRDHQLYATEQIAKEFARGAKVVFLDAPTGTGKSLIGELVRRELRVERGLYVCSTKSLQAQYLADFPYARVLKGRANYIPTKMVGKQGGGWKSRARQDFITCADCDKTGGGIGEEVMGEASCSWCWDVAECPYLVARHEALGAPVGVLNTAYLLAECNGPGKFRGRELVVVDEADLMEQELLGFVELRVPRTVVEKVGLEVPKKGSHMTTIRRWLEEELDPALKELGGRIRGNGVEERREKDRLEKLRGAVKRVVEREEGWVREGDEEAGEGARGKGAGTRPDSLVLKPVSVEDVGARYLWQHADRWLCMTGTLVSAEMEAENLGLEAVGIEWGEVRVPMMFDKERRKVVFLPIASMTRTGQEQGGVGKVLEAIPKLLARHEGVNVLIHTHTYKLAKEISEGVERALREVRDPRPVLTYTDSWGRDRVLEEFKGHAGGEGGGTGAVLVASSMDRGVDLPGDLCRVQIIVKMPFASLGSRQVSERLRGPMGQLWYTVNTVRSIMQMTGRAVRGTDDEAITYIVDEQFSKVLKDGKKMGLWVEWWLDSLEVGRVRELER